MRSLLYLYLLIGLVLLGLVVAEIELSEVERQVRHIGWGIVPILTIYGAAFVVDTVSWQLVLRPARMNLHWLYDLWKIRMVGAAYNRIIPFVGVGGEPIKAIMLNKFRGIGYRDGAASLIAAETCNMLALVVFVASGLVIAIDRNILAAEYQIPAIAATVLFAAVIVTVFLLQLLRLPSFTGDWLSRRGSGRKLENALAHIRAVDDLLVEFYRQRRARFAGALALAFLYTVIAAGEVMVITHYLDHPISLLDAWMITALVEIVRFSTFFIPANLGAQEGAFVLATALVTGQPTLGFSLAVVRRFRDVVWIVWGMLIGWRYSFTLACARAAADRVDGS